MHPAYGGPAAFEGVACEDGCVSDDAGQAAGEWAARRRRNLLDTGFGDDDGAAAPDLARALAAYARDPSTYRDVLEVLQDTRLLVPVVALLGEVEHGPDGLARDKSSDMATVLMTSSAGRTALLAFTSMESMRSWRTDSRPVPVTVPQAARAALQDGAETLLVDVAGPVMLVVETHDLRALADGFRLVQVAGRRAWAKAVAPEQERPEAGA
jgi:hypothetical protein